MSGVVHAPDGTPAPAGVWRLQASEPPFSTEPWATEENGRFVIPLPRGRFWLCAVGAHEWAESETLEFDGSEGRSLDDIVLRLRRPARVTGQALDEVGTPVVGHLVLCVSGTMVANDTEPMANTDAEGRFTLDHCDPGPCSIAGRRFQLVEGETTEVLVRLSADESRIARQRR